MRISSLYNPNAKSPALLLCEHSSNHIPEPFNNLELDKEALSSHIAWDLGALELAKTLSDKLDSRLIYANVSRLVYDLNRPPSAPDAMPEKSEIFEISGNKKLTEQEKEARVKTYYEPFHAAVAQELENAHALITIHSFTPTYKGQKRNLDMGILHDEDSSLAFEMMRQASQIRNYKIELNQPYSAKDGVTHTLNKHATPEGIPNVMIEVRNDLLETPEQQDEISHTLWQLLEPALAQLLPLSKVTH